MIESALLSYAASADNALPREVLHEARRRVLDSFGCMYGSFDEKAVRLLRETMTAGASGAHRVWGTRRGAPAEIAAWANGTAVRALDYNDTYLSLEPCHPSDLLSSVWAAVELAGPRRPGLTLLTALALGYEVACRLCDAASIRRRGWDHVTYLPIASAVACGWVLRLDPGAMRNAIALAVTGNTALRQTRVGTISDWKAACAAYAARAGLAAARLAAAGFTGPSDVFSGRLGFFNQVSGRFSLRPRRKGEAWMMMKTHTKFFPAEHHAQGAIEAAIELRPRVDPRRVRKIEIDAFEAAVSIIGSEREKWAPTTRETADHSLPYLAAVALLDGDVTLDQYEKRRFRDPDVRALLRRVTVRDARRYSAMYPAAMPTKVTIQQAGLAPVSAEVIRPKGYAGRPMSDAEIERKFRRLASRRIPESRQSRIVDAVSTLDRAQDLRPLADLLAVAGE